MPQCCPEYPLLLLPPCLLQGNSLWLWLYSSAAAQQRANHFPWQLSCVWLLLAFSSSQGSLQSTLRLVHSSPLPGWDYQCRLLVELSLCPCNVCTVLSWSFFLLEEQSEGDSQIFLNILYTPLICSIGLQSFAESIIFVWVGVEEENGERNAGWRKKLQYVGQYWIAGGLSWEIK